MRLLYNLLFPVFFLVSAPYYFWKMWRRGGWQRGFGERFGRLEAGKLQALGGAKVLWLHAVSVGEVNVSLQLIAALRPRLAGWKFLVSTTTSTGMGELEKKLPADVQRLYYPVDFPWSVSRALDTVRPAAVVLVEAEFWPNFLWQVRARGLPVFLANARVSDKSFRGYRRGAFLFRELFGNFAAVGAQNDADAARAAVGVAPLVWDDALERSAAPLIRAAAALVGEDDALDAARLVTAWATGFLQMELSGAFRLGGDVDAAFDYATARIVRALTA